MSRVMSQGQSGYMKVKAHRPKEITSLPSPAQPLAHPGDLSFNPIPHEKGGAQGKRQVRTVRE